MTAVAPPPNFQQPISGWGAPNGNSNGNTAMENDVSRLFQRRGPQRTPSSSTISSTASNGTITSTSIAPNGMSAAPADGQNWGGGKKKVSRGLWPTSEAKPVAGLSTARPQTIASATSGPSAASAISALHTPSAMLPSQHNGLSSVQPNGPGQSRTPLATENTAVLYLIPMNGTFERKTITVPFYPDVLKIGRQTNNKTQPTPLNGYFDSKVLSRAHAEIWADRNGKIWIRDIKSSNGTFVNGQRLSQENRESEPQELREQDMLELGIDIVSEDQKTIVHHKVAARVEHAGFYNPNNSNVMDLSFGDIDSPNAGGMMGSGFGQNMGPMRNRQGSQGSIGSGGRLGSGPGSVAGSQVSAVGQQRHNTFWLQPISMEQVVKKLNSELKLAKQQTQDLSRASHTIESLLSNEPKKDAVKFSPNPQSLHIKPSPAKADLKARFSDPPAPPPQAPLPEKPDGPSFLPSLRRNDTERPMLNGSPIRTGRLDGFSPISSLADPQNAALAEALATAKKDLEAQSAKLKELEQIIKEEKKAREAAEERAHRLEAEKTKDSNAQVDQVPDSETATSSVVEISDDETLVDPQSEKPSLSSSPTESNSPADVLQKRIDSMTSEMSEMRQQMEKFRQRADFAEAESTKDRATLAEMIEKLREQQKKKGNKVSSRSRRAITSDKGKSEEVAANGHATSTALHAEVKSHELAQEFAEALQQVLAQRQNQDELSANKVPVASMVSIVFIGVGIMAWLNSWPKVER